jgi:hypothetical protein
MLVVTSNIDVEMESFLPNEQIGTIVMVHTMNRVIQKHQNGKIEQIEKNVIVHVM